MTNYTTIILAAGQGTRLRPHTDNKPKCMVELAGKPLLHHQMDAMFKCGIKENIVVVGGYRIDGLEAQGAEVIPNPQYDSTNMVYTLFCAREHMQPGKDLLISYGDIIYEPRVLNALLECDAPVCLAADREWKRLWELRMDDPLSDAETFRMDKNGNVIELGKEPKSYDQVQAQYLGLIKIRGDKVSDLISTYDAMDRTATYDGKDFDNMYLTSLIQHLIDNKWQVKATLIDNGWLEVDTADELRSYEEMLTRDMQGSILPKLH